MYSLEHEGLEVQERTLRFWVAEGVLEKPLRKPFKHADGRKRYFPTRVVGEIAELLRLQQEGWKLTQIKQRLRTPARANQSHTPSAEELAKLMLQDFLGNGEFRDKLRNIDSADPSTPEWRKIRNFLVARLSRFVGRKQAVRSVTSFMVGMSKRDVSKLLRRLSGRQETGSEESEPALPTLSPAVLRTRMRNLYQPAWEGPGPEPVLSLRLRSAVERLKSVLFEPSESTPLALDKQMGLLRELHRQTKASLEFLDSGVDSV